jgi:pilus assembly protein Flp/PilA
VQKIIAFLKDESGASAAEYALILGIVGLGIVGAAQALGGAVSTSMSNAASIIQSNSSAS